jgi:hypothetical protein
MGEGSGTNCGDFMTTFYAVQRGAIVTKTLSEAADGRPAILAENSWRVSGVGRNRGIRAVIRLGTHRTLQRPGHRIITI